MPCFAKTHLVLAAGLLGAMTMVQAAHARCTEEAAADVRRGTTQPARSAGSPALAATQPETTLEPMAQMQLIAREAARRSAEVGASRLMAEAAAYDVEETRAGRRPTVSVNATLGPGRTVIDERVVTTGFQATGSLNVSGNVYDGGRLTQLTQWREQLLNAARHGSVISQEQVVLTAVLTALERNRYRVQAQVYQQHSRKMSCLVEALEEIVAADKGRTSELVQARKTLAQTEVSRDAAIAQSRQSELRLRKFVGEQLAFGEGISAVLAATPDLGEVNREIERGHETLQLQAQAEAMDSYRRALEAGQKPQVNWTLNKTEGTRGDSRSSSWQAGVQLNYTLYNGGADKAAELAAAKRAEAARQQVKELLNTKFARTAELYDVSTTSFDKAKRYVEILRDSDRVRGFTFQQWSQLGRRSLFDVMSAESDHFNLRIAYVNSLYDGFAANAQLRSHGQGLVAWLTPELAGTQQ